MEMSPSGPAERRVSEFLSSIHDDFIPPDSDNFSAREVRLARGETFETRGASSASSLPDELG